MLTVMDVKSSPVYVDLVRGVLHIRTVCCKAQIQRGLRGERRCVECDSLIRTTPKWVGQYDLTNHSKDEQLVAWLSFWTGVAEEDIQVEVKL